MTLKKKRAPRQESSSKNLTVAETHHIGTATYCKQLKLTHLAMGRSSSRAIDLAHDNPSPQGAAAAAKLIRLNRQFTKVMNDLESAVTSHV